MSRKVQIIGSYLSPYVRKVLVALELKGIAYEIDPIVAFHGDDRFSAASPLRRIPVLFDGDLTLCDSSVICQYLEDVHPEPALFPLDVRDRARARWIEEYADTRLGDVLIWRLFNQRAIRPFVWGHPVDEAVVERTLSVDLPEVLDYLETFAPEDGFAFGGALSIADVSVAAFFRNAAFVKVSIDAARWPKTAGWVARTWATAPFETLRPFENVCMRTPPLGHREALAKMGAPLWPETHGTDQPREGIMPI